MTNILIVSERTFTCTYYMYVYIQHVHVHVHVHEDIDYIIQCVPGKSLKSGRCFTQHRSSKSVMTHDR